MQEKKTFKRLGALGLASVAVFMMAPQAAMASTNPTFNSSYNMKYRVYGSTNFTITNDGYVTVDIRQTSGATTGYQVNIQQDGGSFVGGTCTRTISNGATAQCSFRPGNTSKPNKVVLTKNDDGRYVSGSVYVRLAQRGCPCLEAKTSRIRL